MGIFVELRGEDDTVIRLPDPSGGTFDAAGDFDRFYVWQQTRVMGRMSTEGTTEIASSDMHELIAEIEQLLPDSKEGPERRGLIRLRTLAAYCADHVGTRLAFVGD